MRYLCLPEVGRVDSSTEWRPCILHCHSYILTLARNWVHLYYIKYVRFFCVYKKSYWHPMHLDTLNVQISNLSQIRLWWNLFIIQSPIARGRKFYFYRNPNEHNCQSICLLIPPPFKSQKHLNQNLSFNTYLCIWDSIWDSRFNALLFD